MKKVKIGIFEGDPFTGCCGLGIGSVDEIEKLRRMLTEREETVKKLMEEFQGKVEIEREIVNRRRSPSDYPQQVRKALFEGVKLPFILIDGEIVLKGAFPSLDDFKQIISRHIRNDG